MSNKFPFKIPEDMLSTGVLMPHPDNTVLRVVHPKHYNQGNIEVIDYVKSSMTPAEFKGFIKGNVIKYLAREEHKNGIEDMMKAKFYLDYYLKEFESPKIIIKGVGK